MIAAFSFCACAAGSASAQDAGQVEAARDFSIPAGEATATLRWFSEQAGLELLYSTDAAAGVSTNPVQGRFSPHEALALLIRETPLRAQRHPKTGGYAITLNRNASGEIAPPSKPGDETVRAAPAAANPTMKKTAFALLRSFLGLALAAPVAGSASDLGGTIEGRVFNAATGNALVNARISIPGTTRETLSDEAGSYRFADVPPGAVRLEVSYLGMERQSASMNMPADGTVRRDFELSLAGSRPGAPGDVVKLDAFTVVVDREMSAQALALNEQRNAPNIKSVVAFDEYNDVSDGNIGEFMKFIPGVSLVYSGIAATDVSIRGFPGYTSAITIDGSQVASASLGESRNVTLFGVPANNVSRVEVTKVPTPDMPASGLGGSVNIVSKSGFERRTPRFNYNLYSNFNASRGLSLRKLAGPYPDLDTRYINPSADLSYLYPFNDKLAVTLAASQIITYIQSDDAIVDYDLGTNLQRTANWRTSPQIVTLTSGRAGVDWKMTPGDVVSASIQTRKRESSSAMSTLTANYGAGAIGEATFTQGAETGVGSISQSFGYLHRVMYTKHALLRYAHRGDAWKIDATASHSIGKTHEDTDDHGFFSGVTANRTNLIIRGTGIGSAAGKEALLPTSFTIFTRTGTPIDFFDGGDLPITNVTTAKRDIIDTKRSIQGNLSRELGGAIPVTLKVGFSLAEQDWDTRSYNKIYNFRTGAPESDRLAGANGAVDLRFSEESSSFSGNKVKWITPKLLYELFKRRPEFFVLNQTNEYMARVNASKNLIETITAGYIRSDLKLLKNRLGIIAGVRFEQTTDEGFGPKNDPTEQYQKDASGQVVRNAAGSPILLTTDALERIRLQYQERAAQTERQYRDYYPSLNANYQLTDDLLLRAGYARTIGRPNLNLVIPGITIADVTAAQANQVITVVNTGLKPWTADSYDLSLEAYMLKGGFGSIGVFQKTIKDFFGSRRVDATPELLASFGLPADDVYLNYDVVTMENAGDADITGMEFTYKQLLTFLPHWGRGIQVFLNFTSMSLGGSSTSDFSGFSPRTLSWGVNLSRARYSIKFNSSEQGETRRQPVAANAANGIPEGTYLWQGALRRYTLSAEYRITRNFALYGSVTDFNTDGFLPFQKRYASADTPEYAKANRIQDWGMTATIGIKGEF